MLFIRSESLVPVHTQGEGIHRDMNTKRQGSLRVILEAAHHCTASADWGKQKSILSEGT